MGTKPPALVNRPLLLESDYFFVSCFYDLNEFREIGQHANKLNLTDIKSYMDIIEIVTSAERLRFVKVMKELDETYINYKIATQT